MNAKLVLNFKFYNKYMADNDIPENPTDRATEYFELKEQARALRADLKDIQTQHEDYLELEELNKKAKILREKIKDDNDIKTLKAKIEQIKERMDLIKELIRIELIDTAQEEVVRDGRKLKLVYILKEMKDHEDK